MVNVLLYFASISSFLNTVNSCVATTPGTTPSPTVTTTLAPGVTTTTVPTTGTTTPTTVTTTTTPSVTTTTTAGPTTTTTAAAAVCNTCTERDIAFFQSSGGDTIDANGIMFSTDPATGCVSLVATCTTPFTGTFAYMQFRAGGEGPAENAAMGSTLNVPLACVDGTWVYTSDGNSRKVTTVLCRQFPLP